MPPAAPAEVQAGAEQIAHEHVDALEALEIVSGVSRKSASQEKILDSGFRGEIRGRAIMGSERLLNLENPIRKISDALKPDPNSTKKMISLAQGDPTVYGHLRAPEIVIEAIRDSVESYEFNGYSSSTGLLQARKAVAERFSPRPPCKQLDPERDVFLTGGCGQALQVMLEALYHPGCNILLPRPGYPLYECYCRLYGIEMKFYDLQPESNWEIDCSQLAQLADASTIALILCNPGNPSSSVYSREHLTKIAASADAAQIPIISDEVYGGICFQDREFVPMGAIEGSTPVITVGSISKQYLLPGWRLGWILLSDQGERLARGRVREAIVNYLQSNAAPCSLVQAALPKILSGTPDSFFRDLSRSLESSCTLCCDLIEQAHGISCRGRPQGGMFVMLKIDTSAYADVTDDVDWCAKLLKEESVALVPGKAFNFPGWARMVSALPTDVLNEALHRIQAFCSRHAA